MVVASASMTTRKKKVECCLPDREEERKGKEARAKGKRKFRGFLKNRLRKRKGKED